MTETENLRVVVRIRPLNDREIQAGRQTVTRVHNSSRTICIVKPNTQPILPVVYSFDHILEEECTQNDAYCRTTRCIVDKVFEGYNGTVLAYGPTGTGKTYTMTGLKSHDKKGIIPNTFAHIFNHIANAKEGVTFSVNVTYLEIYNEHVRDLLAKPSASKKYLDLLENNDLGVLVKNLSAHTVNKIGDLEDLMNIGNKNRAVGTTDLNFSSSRSHTIFTITVESKNTNVHNASDMTKGKLHLVDLAGSERQKKSRATDVRFKEAAKINQSLSVLGNVISALVDGKRNHIPYRNSKLTRLLKDSLGGNSKTVLITTISPCENDVCETLSTLRFANRAKNIKNYTYVNKQSKDTNTESTKPRADVNTVQNEGRNVKNNINKSNNKTRRALEKEIRLKQEKIRDKWQKLIKKLEKAQEQIFFLKHSATVIQKKIQMEEQLHQSLTKQEAERIAIEKRYSNLQVEASGMTKKLKRLIPLINGAKKELAKVDAHNQRKLEDILDTVRGLTRELQLVKLAIGTYIPKEYQTMIEKYIHWNKDTGEFQLKCMAYTGNNMRKRKTNSNIIPKQELSVPVVKYRQYNSSNKAKSNSSDPRSARSG